MASSGYLWRRLGDLLVAKGLLTQGGLERALTEQERTGRMLGEILIERGWVSSTELAGALAEQHGLELELVPAMGAPRRPFATVSPTGGAFRTTLWRPLGRILVDKGLLAQHTLERALVSQRASGRLLGEILVERGWVSAEGVAEALAEQQGLPRLEETELHARLIPPEESPAARPSALYEVRVPTETGPLHVSATFLDATDFAFDVLEQIDPETLEIAEVENGEREIVWTYRRDVGREAEDVTRPEFHDPAA